MKKKMLTGSLLVASLITLAACGNKANDKKSSSSEAKTEKVSKSTEEKATLKDGNYKAESEFDKHGWKVVHTITVTDGLITASDFNYENKDGKYKADDDEYNKKMKAKSGTSSKEATEKLNDQLVKKQTIDDVEVVSGATHTSANFKASAKALLKAASKGQTETILIDLPK